MQRAASVQSDLSRVCTSGAAVRFIQRCSRRLMLAATIMRLQLYTRQDKQESYVCVQGNRVLSIFAKRKVQKNACNHALCKVSVAASSSGGACASAKGPAEAAQSAQCRGRGVYQASAALAASEPPSSNRTEAMSRDAATHPATNAAQPPRAM